MYRNLFACGHNRVIDLYTDSILSSDTCPMVGHVCQDYTTFQVLLWKHFYLQLEKDEDYVAFCDISEGMSCSK